MDIKCNDRRITFLSQEPNENVLSILNKLIHEIICIKAVISFWSLNINYQLTPPSHQNNIPAITKGSRSCL